MKKFFVFIIMSIIFLWINTSLAYSPTIHDKQYIISLENKINSLIINKKDLRNFYYQLRKIRKNYKLNDKLDYYINELYFYFWNKIQKWKQEQKILAKHNKEIFIWKYESWLFDTWNIDENCIWWYNSLDDLAYCYDFSTSLLLATRYIESNCWYYLPKNWNWPFQIVSKNYWTWKITEDVFFQSVIDFLNFAQNKINRYNSKNKSEWFSVNVSYTWFDIDSIVRFGALYNWLSWYTVYWDAKPLNKWYVWNNFNKENTWSVRDWLLATFLKALKFEIWK